MSNPLTGDFDAVAEISVPTINRVLAAQHQETGPDPEDEIYFHSLSTPVPPTRLGDAAGVRGIAEVQVSTP
ncbi:MAG: hypothetical protein JW918_19285, partial [Anaerolineae bacterium]|nr:hypothetical protein [Anaerolineae bacterium]